MHRRDIDNVMRALARNGYSRKIEWMSQNETIYRLSRQFSEGPDVYIRGREQGLGGVRASSLSCQAVTAVWANRCAWAKNNVRSKTDKTWTVRKPAQEKKNVVHLAAARSVVISHVRGTSLREERIRILR